MIAEGLEPAEIDARVREVTARGESLYTLDEAALAALEPDLIVTQALCAVCAVSYDEVCAVAAGLPGGPAVLSLDPETLDEVLADLATIAAAAGSPELGPRLLDELGDRLAAVDAAVAGADRRPASRRSSGSTRCTSGGHWVPEMIARAGGADVLGEPGRKSRVVSWDDVVDAAPEVVVAMPCGLYAPEAAAQTRRELDRLRATGATRVIAVDAASSFSRPGPRLVDGVELLAHLLHPERAAAPAGIAHEVVAELSSAPR